MSFIIQKLLKQLNDSVNNIQSPPSLSLRRQRRLYFFTIIGVIVSFILGIVSLVLAIKVQNNAVKIDKMDSLLGEMVKQENINQASLNQLTVIAKLNNESITQLAAISKTLGSQYATTVTNTEPKIKLLSASSSKPTDIKGIVTLTFTNSGSRPAENFALHMYAIDQNNNTFIATGSDFTNTSSEITPGQEKNQDYTLIYKDVKRFDRVVFRFDFIYLDKLDNKKHLQRMYFKFDWKGTERSTEFIDDIATKNKIDNAIIIFDKVK